jgi:hypothetical protein
MSLREARQSDMSMILDSSDMITPHDGGIRCVDHMKLTAVSLSTIAVIGA